MKQRRTRRTRILLVDDHPIVLSGLRNALASHPRFEIVGEATDGEEAINKAKKHSPDVVVLDITLPGMSGIEAAKILRKQVPLAKILALTVHNRKEYIVEMVHVGASGYVLKDASPRQLARAIEVVSQGDSFFSPAASRILAEEVKSIPQKPGRRKHDVLSKRERQVMELVVAGLNSREISERLGLSIRTIETHRERVMTKLDVHTVGALVKYAFDQGLVRVG